MIQPPQNDDRPTPFNPQLALRVAFIGTCALAMFAIIFFRLWFLQVLSGSQYREEASVQAQRSVAIAAPRGEILDRTGNVMVSSAAVPTVEIAGADLPVPITTAELAATGDRPPAADVVLYRRLAGVLGMSTRRRKCVVDGAQKPPYGTLATIHVSPIACLVAQGVANVPYDNVTIKQDVQADVWYYLNERQLDFPGVVVEQEYLRQYRDGDLAAQLFGTVGPLSSSDVSASVLKQADGGLVPSGHFKGVSVSDVVGQSGLEYEYNQELQGKDGEEEVKVNADGQFKGYGNETQPIQGENLQLSIDSRLQRVGQSALATSIQENGTDVGQNSGGAFVALDPQNGQVYAMGSEPTFNPSVFTHPIADFKKEFGNDSGDPLINRAIQSVGPDGSTFKVITATAALESGAWLLGQTYDDTGHFCFPGDTSDCLHNSGNGAYGVVDLQRAIQVSDDVFFYNLGYQMNSDNPQGGALQTWARQFGIGRKTGIDLPGEVAGTLPTPAWRSHRNTLEADCDSATGPYRYTNGNQISAHLPKTKAGKPQPGWHRSPKHAPGGCGIAVYPFEYWTAGDNVNTGVGQGDDQLTPLQLAIVYSAIENGGTIVTPHVGEDIQSANGTVLQRIDPGPKRHLHIEPQYLDAIRDGLHLAAQSSGGTSDDVMGHFPLPVYGKTGTAQLFPDGPYGPEVDNAWYACYVPASATSKPIVVVVTVAQGGFGDVAAAPVAHEILSQWFLGHPGTFSDGVEVGDGL